MLSAMNGRLHVWQAMSPSAPVPKSHQPRHSNGWYTLSAYGRHGAGPIQASQFNVVGTGFIGGRRS